MLTSSFFFSKIFYIIAFVFIMSILFLIVSILGIYIKSRFNAEIINNLLLKYRGIKGNIIASIIGVITPFCSCTTVPVFSGLIGINVEFGVAMTFLISSPTMNIAAFILLLSLFGIKEAVVYLSACIFLSIAGGIIIGKITGNNQIKESFIYLNKPVEIVNLKTAMLQSLKSLRFFVFIFVIAAVIGALMHNYIPDDFIAKFSVINSIYSVFIAVIIGSLIYADIIILIPIGYALMLKGVNHGVIMALMISASGISIPGIIMLSKIIKLKPLILFVISLLFLYSGLGIIYFFAG